MTNDMTLIATSAFGLEALVKRELQDLGATELEVFNGYVAYKANMELLAKSNLWLRTADRVLIRVGEFPARTFDELFEGTKALPWAELLPRDAYFPVDGRSVKSTLSSVPACQRIVKKAIVESLRDGHGAVDLPEDGPKFPIEVSIQKDIAMLTLDTSGAGLHKRGYRTESALAPIKETLAAALVLLSRWKPHRVFADPLCGSGTIAIEAALIAKGIAPGARRDFLAESWPWMDERVWTDARTESFMNERKPIELDIRASDVDGSMVEMAKRHAKFAGVLDVMSFERADVRGFRPEAQYGCVVTNPPYGERIGEEHEVEVLYRAMGRAAGDLDTWSWFIITSHPNFERLFGKRADKNRKLYNGRIETHLYQYLGPLPPRQPRAEE